MIRADSFPGFGSPTPACPKVGFTLPETNMQTQKGPIKTTVLLKGDNLGFHVGLGECRFRVLVQLPYKVGYLSGMVYACFAV